MAAFDIDSNKGKKTDTQRDGAPITNVKALQSDTLLSQAANIPELYMGLFQPTSLSEFQQNGISCDTITLSVWAANSRGKLTAVT